MKILSVGAEVAGIHKTGGLGDVIRDLALELQKQGEDIMTVLPMYKNLVNEENMKDVVWGGDVTYAGGVKKITVYKVNIPNTNLFSLLIHEPDIISSENTNDAIRFGLFSKALIYLLKSNAIQADLLHLHDWHTGLIPLTAAYFEVNVKTVFTIHNMLFQGNTTSNLIDEIGIDRAFRPSIIHDIQDGDLNLLLQGIVNANFVTTVSPNYKVEILNGTQDGGLGNYLRNRGDAFTGVLNAIDVEVWNPDKDAFLNSKFNLSNWKLGKMEAKKQLASKLKISNISENEVWVVYVGRADARQKGIGLILEAIYKQNLLENKKMRLIMLAEGDSFLEEQIANCSAKYENFDSFIEFNDSLAHLIYAAGDMAIIPSAYEPCGLIQMISMRYGCVPIARTTGGLKDTIIHGKDGYLFEEYSAAALARMVTGVAEVFENKPRWVSLVEAGMSKNWSWESSAAEYRKIYAKVLEQ